MLKKILLVLFIACCSIQTVSAQFTIAITSSDNPTNDPHTSYEGELKRYNVLITLTGTLPAHYQFIATVTNGTIVQQYLTPAFPPQKPVLLYVDVRWGCNVAAGNLVVSETNSGASTTYNNTVISYLNSPNYCATVTPDKQNLLLGQQPQALDVITCSPYCHDPNSSLYQYQWQAGDVPIGVFPQIPPAGFTNITGGTHPSYFPPAQSTEGIKAYRRITTFINPQTGLPETRTSSIAVISTFGPLTSGSITFTGTYNNGAPIFNQNPATGGLCDGFNYLYTWEVSYDNITWNVAGTGVNYPASAPISGSCYIRRKVDCNGQALYSNTEQIIVAALSPGTIGGGGSVTFNTQPSVTQTLASGSVCSPTDYMYTWERSINNGPWVSFGSGAAYPANAGIVGNCKIRRKVFCVYEEAYSNEIIFTTSYTSPNTENLNYVRTNDIVIPNVHTWEQADALTVAGKLQSTTYLDGLGRPIQIVSKQGTNSLATSEPHLMDPINYPDLVTPITYDGLGRKDKDYIPYNTGAGIGFYKPNAHLTQRGIINRKFVEPSTNIYTYSQTFYDGSPLNRVVNVKLPGSALNNDPNYQGISSDYDFNKLSENVRVWSVGFNSGDKPYIDNSFYANGIYTDNKLAKSIVKDEKGKLVITYTDLSGNTILKRVQLADNVANPPLGDGGGWVSTYYVVDDFGRLRYTITPKAVELMNNSGNWVIDDDYKTGLCFYQEYDKRGRVVVKHSPDGGEVWMVYDNRDRLVLSQDENQRHRNTLPGKLNQWSYSLYDEQDRPLVTGLIDDTRDRLQMQAFVDGIPNGAYAGNQQVDIYTGTWETITAFNPVAGKIGSGGLYCQTCTQSYANTVNYYDDYARRPQSQKPLNLNIADFPATSSNLYVEAPVVSYSRIRGAATVSKVRVLDDKYDNGNINDEKFLTTTSYYDEKGRVIQTHADNYKGGINGVDVSAVLYDFAGKALCTRGRHSMPGNDFDNLFVFTRTKYDLLGRPFELLKLYTKNSADVSNASKYKKLSNTWLDPLGFLKNRIIGQDPQTNGPMETQDYSFNIQGRLLGVNTFYATSPQFANQWYKHFGYVLGYENADGRFAQKQYNGSITGVIWRSQGDNALRKFDYEYDNLNRFKKASFAQKEIPTAAVFTTSIADFTTTVSGYDANGNIQGMKHLGIVPGTNGGIVLDDLQYNYDVYNNGKTNKLGRVDDLASASYSGKQGDFKDYTAFKDYNYDFNGNLKYDKNKNILDVNSSPADNDPNAGIISNFLDLPESITIKGKSKTEYIYDAAGGKLGKKVTNLAVTPNTVSTTWFIGGFVYEEANNSTNLQYILNEEGRLRIVENYNGTAPGSAGALSLILTGNVDFGINNKWGAWDYYIKDHLGNTRMVLTEEKFSQQLDCKMETADPNLQLEEEREFGSPQNNEVIATRTAKSLTNWTANTSSYVSKLINTPGKSVGPNAILKVMAGDQISARVDYFYELAGNSQNTSVLTNVVNTLLGSLGASTVAGGGIKDNINTTIPGLTNSNIFSYIQNQQNTPPNSTTPRAFLNIVFFDEQFRYVDESSTAKPVQPITTGTSIATFIPAITKAPKNGYVYIYLSNETTNIPVYFDNLIIAHDRGAMVEDNAYYPYGLKMQGISSRAAGKIKTKEGYQGDYSQLDEESGYNEFALRFYDAQIGRWIHVDPYDVAPGMYNGMGNDPINKVDPTGGFDYIGEIGENGYIYYFWDGSVTAENYSKSVYSNNPKYIYAGPTLSEGAESDILNGKATLSFGYVQFGLATVELKEVIVNAPYKPAKAEFINGNANAPIYIFDDEYRSAFVQSIQYNKRARMESEKTPIISADLTLTFGTFGAQAKVEGLNVGAVYSLNETDIIGYRDGQLVAIGKNSLGVSETRNGGAFGVGVFSYEMGMTSLKGPGVYENIDVKKIGIMGIEYETNNGKLLNKVEMGFKVGFFIGVDGAVKINTGYDRIGVSPKRTNYEIAESSRIRNFIFKYPFK